VNNLNFRNRVKLEGWEGEGGWKRGERELSLGGKVDSEGRTPQGKRKTRRDWCSRQFFRTKIISKVKGGGRRAYTEKTVSVRK